jgi:hypothetical protein
MGSTRTLARLVFTVSVVVGITSACASDTTETDSAQNDATEEIVAQSQSALTGNLTYALVRSANPTADENDAYGRIKTAMDAAVAMYNGQTTLSRQITVQYVPSVGTADGNMNGTIRFGSNRSYMTQRTAMHEISHVMGVGQSARYKALVVNGKYTGSNALETLRAMVGESSSSVLKADQQHFWPYGLNYESEWSTVNGQRNARIVAAMKRDGI